MKKTNKLGLIILIAVLAVGTIFIGYKVISSNKSLKAEKYLNMVPYFDFTWGDKIDDAYSDKTIENIDEKVLLIRTMIMTSKSVNGELDGKYLLGTNGEDYNNDAEVYALKSDFEKFFNDSYNREITLNEFSYRGDIVRKGDNAYVGFAASGASDMKKVGKVLEFSETDNKISILEIAGFIETEESDEETYFVYNDRNEKEVYTCNKISDCTSYIKKNLSKFNTYEHVFVKTNGLYKWNSTTRK